MASGRVECTVDEIWKMAASKRRQDEKHLKILRELGALAFNKQCFDCHQRGPTYVNMTIGSFVCTSCSGILRGLNPPHRVKSISMASFTVEEIEFIRNRGNEYCRREWMGTYDGQPPIESETKDEQRIKDFMITKYERKRWYTDPSTFRHQPLPQLTSPPPPPPAPVNVNNMKQATTTNNITITRPVMQSASFPPPTSLGKPSMDLLGDLGGSTNNANASFANFDNFVSVPASVSTTLSCSPPLTSSNLEMASTDDSVPIVGKSFFSRITTQKRTLGLSIFSSFGHKGASRLPSIEPTRQSKLKTGVNVESTAFHQMTSSTPSFLGPSNPSHTAAATNIIADSAFGGIASASSNPSSSTAPAPIRPPPVANSATVPLQTPSQQMQLKDRYAALADLDSLFNSAPANNGTAASSTIDWDVPKSNTSKAWQVNSTFTSGGHQLQPGPISNKEFDQVQTPSNPFTGMNFNSSVWNQKPSLAPAPSPGNPFASSILNQANSVGSSSPEPFGAFSNPNAVMSNYPTGPTNMPWGNSPVAVPTPFLAATNGNYAAYKTTAQPQFGLWQPSIGNPFVAAVVSAPQKSNSSNPFL